MNYKELTKVMDSKYTMDEMWEDYKSSPSTMAEKKEIASKYGCESKKWAEIQTAILLAMREDRSSRDAWSESDVRAFMNLVDYAEAYKKLATFLAQEKRAFVEYMKGVLYERVKKFSSKVDIETPITRLPYGMCYADMSSVNRYANVSKFLRETSDEAVSAKASLEDKLGAIRSKLDAEMAEFKKAFLAKIQARAEKIYDNAPELIEKCKAREAKYLGLAEEREKSLRAEGKGWREIFYDYYIKEYKDAASDARKEMYEYKTILSKSREEYVAEELKNGEAIYTRNVNALAEKVNAWDMNVDAMTVKRVAEDPKYFEMLVTDGVHGLYARSIWAAEDSDLVTPHFRFIITEKKSRR